VHEIEHFYRRYHSSRYVRDLLVIRLEEPLDEAALEALNEEFADIVVHGRILQRPALAEEAGDTEIADKPRLVFPFARRNFGRLRVLIDRLNAAE
jgi:hypothetical protein